MKISVGGEAMSKRGAVTRDLATFLGGLGLLIGALALSVGQARLLTTSGTFDPEVHARAAAPEAPLAGLRWIDASAELLPLRARQASSSMDAEPADLNGDGHLDLIVATEFGVNMLLMGEGGGELRDATPDAFRRLARDSEDIGIADFDGDGRLDLVFVSEDDQIDELWLADSAGAFVLAEPQLPATGRSNAVLAVDLDADGDADILVGNSGQNQLLLNDGEGRFSDATEGRLPIRSDSTQDLELGDLNQDGQADLVIGNEDGNRLLLGDGRGHFVDSAPEALPRRAGEETREADLGDVNGDGSLDLYFANVVFQVGTDARDRLLIGAGDGSFAEAPAGSLPAATFNTVDADLVDLDGDGDLDLIQAHAFGGGMRIFENDGTGRFRDVTAEVTEPGVVDSGVDIEAADFNADGRPDLYLANYQSADRLLLAEAPSRPPRLWLPWLRR
jgi:hypothetical protein